MTTDWKWLEDLSERHNQCACTNVIYDDELERAIACIKEMRETLEKMANHNERRGWNDRPGMTIEMWLAEETLAKCAKGDFKD